MFDFFFFFQAEDGIRDRSPSRGLGDVYKRQEKGSSGEDTVGNISVAQAIKIAKLKQSDSLSYELKNTVKEILGTCVSMRVTVDEKPAKDIQQAIDAGEYVDLFAEDSKTAKD